MSSVDDGLAMARKLECDSIDLIVLDWDVAGENGLSICLRPSSAGWATALSLPYITALDEVTMVINRKTSAVCHWQYWA